VRPQRSFGESGHAGTQDDRALSIERNREYDPFAAIYNRYWGEEYRASVLPVVERLLLSRLRRNASVLDVCCGTGQFTRVVRGRGFEMAGLDASAAMVAFAKRNAPHIPFTVADVRDFSLGRRFHAAYSVFESLNHVPDIPGLALAFARVRRHLEPGAPFLFDLNREEAFIQFWNERDAIVSPDNACIMISHYDQSTRVATCDITVFDLEGQVAEDASAPWRRTDFTVRQTCHSISAVSSALSGAGFSDITLYDAADAGMMGDIGYARTFFLAIARPAERINVRADACADANALLPRRAGEDVHESG
jgi:SAM-dependent methyltransferase